LEVKLPARIDPAAVCQAQLVWKGTGYWLHVNVEKPVPEQVKGSKAAGADPGIVHSLALTDGEESLVISGRLFVLLTTKNYHKSGKIFTKNCRGNFQLIK